jgi:hypothetical protein
LKSDLKFKTENRVKRKENRTEKIEEEAHLAVARLAGPASQSNRGPGHLPKWYGSYQQDPPTRAIVFNLWIEGSCSLSTFQCSAASRSAPPPSEAYKMMSAATGETLNPPHPLFSLEFLSQAKTLTPAKFSFQRLSSPEASPCCPRAPPWRVIHSGQRNRTKSFSEADDKPFPFISGSTSPLTLPTILTISYLADPSSITVSLIISRDPQCTIWWSVE